MVGSGIAIPDESYPLIGASMTPSGVYPHSRAPHSHGMTGTPTYRTWEQMKQRCTKLSNPSYPRYGGRGIKLCERWMTFENFYADMGERPAGKSIERKHNDGNYEPGNCRWATPTEQARNRRSSARVCAFGITKTIAEWAEDNRCVVSLGTLGARLRRGWDAEFALLHGITVEEL